LTLQVRL